MSELNQEKSFGVNLILIGLIASIMIQYPITHNAYHLFLGLLLVMILIRFTQTGIKFKNLNLFFSFTFIFGFIYLAFSALDNSSFFIRNYLLMFLLIFYMYLMFSKEGQGYAIKTYKQLALLLNTLSVFNLYQVIFNKPLLLKFMELRTVGYNYHLGTDQYRTMSVFDHPIICGLFFVIAFLINIYVIKSPIIKYPLQFLLLLNIYSTMSRSAWIALVIVFLVYGILNFKKIFKIPKNIRLTYNQILFIYIGIIFALLGLGMLILNFNELYEAIIKRFGDSLSFNSTDGSSLQRTMTISLILEHMKNSNLVNLFFGYGSSKVGPFMVAHPITMQGFSTTDNQYLAWFFELGLIGIIAYLATLFFILKKIFNKSRNWVSELSLLCLIVISIELFFFELFEWQAVGLILAFVVSCLTFNHEKPNKIETTNISEFKNVS
ncbi:O-antigen ligase family protein [Bacillus sp. Au-Bac7]|uniref:O-antigen ligase family protein n=1 Tax=Bacillus sp. Au-Bac7 TaxID=2906458 RepID=UPI001E4A1D67|nr:O-antigen ligase family protein [Bacillus sp. Au-Bac7]MCE4049550.1 O-antigen ligase family protein [Bacillus sp. Au-Bac7]